MSMPIRYCKNHEIDKTKWDKCISDASNGLVYAYSFCLDALCTWDALVYNDYEVVMPLPYRSKWGFKYVYQLPFIQRLGVFGATTPQQVDAMYTAVTKHFRFIHYNTDQQPANKDFKLVKHINYVINLHTSLHTIRANISKECLKNIRKATQRSCNLSTGVAAEQVIDLYRKAYDHLHPTVTNKDYDQFLLLTKKAIATGFAETFAIKDETGEIVFAAALLKDHRRLYYVIGAPTEKGRQLRATYFFINSIIEKYAGSNLLLDLEGSDIPNVAAFYQRFGPAAEEYYEVKYNNLPFPINLLK
ncbi:hypothetical protein [Aridibaculum aurantiacum]|uniref:hypothetical protein n=1 Tax=Aridibaculum aurantiacum TaxID=2810307 RepID=UPI001A96CF48|nr:hypothetical protein [Aridibaculum aurantiacum]